jgi:hypothetical protein
VLTDLVREVPRVALVHVVDEMEPGSDGVSLSMRRSSQRRSSSAVARTVGRGSQWCGQRVPWHMGGAGGGDGRPRGWLEPAVIRKEPTTGEGVCCRVASMAPSGGAARLSDRAHSGR